MAADTGIAASTERGCENVFKRRVRGVAALDNAEGLCFNMRVISSSGGPAKISSRLFGFSPVQYESAAFGDFGTAAFTACTSADVGAESVLSAGVPMAAPGTTAAAATMAIAQHHHGVRR
jgi:hypothetical protein